MAINKLANYICSECTNGAIWLSEDVWYCQRCQMGRSVLEYKQSQHQQNEDIDKRLKMLRAGLVATFVSTGKTVCVIGDGLWSGVGTGAYPSDQDCVALFDSFDKAPPREAMQFILDKVLAAGGILIISMPELPYLFAGTTDVEYLQREFEYWKYNKPTERLTYFTRQGLRTFLESFQLEFVWATNQESFLDVDPNNPGKSMMTIVCRKPITSFPKTKPVFSGAETTWTPHIL